MELIKHLNNNNINIVEITDEFNRVYKCDKSVLLKTIEKNQINNYKIKYLCKNSKCNLLDYQNLNCRIEPGALIRDKVILGNNVVVMMGAIINIGASIGDNTMIDMGAVIGSKAKIGKNCHISAGAVIAGVIEPPSKKEVIIEDNVFVGSNAVIFEGVTIKSGSVIGAGSIVTKDVPNNVLVYGNPAKVIREITKEIIHQTEINLKIR